MKRSGIELRGNVMSGIAGGKMRVMAALWMKSILDWNISMAMI